MALSTKTRNDPVDTLRRLHTHLDAIQNRMRSQHAKGWKRDALATLHDEAAQLQDTAARVVPDWGEAFNPLMSALQDAGTTTRGPTKAAGNALLAATDDVRTRLPPLPEDTGNVFSAAHGPVRAESPPPHYWRRWGGDAAAAVPPDALDKVAPATAAPPSSAPPATDADPADAAPYRVLVVEDDRSQALFAQSVLDGAGMQARVVTAPGDVLQVMEEFRPDLVLMDLHMPGLSGTELTDAIRAHPAFTHMPIVFLTGDPDPERQFEVLEHGADDFLNKPIRPRHLIASVQSRVKRARSMQRERFGESTRHPTTGLYTRPHLMQRITNALGEGTPGGVLFVEILNIGALRESYGYAGIEQLMHEISLRIGQLAGAQPAARLNDNAFVVLAADGDLAQLEPMARGLRDGISQPPFDMDGVPLRVRAAIGYASLVQGFTDAGSVLDAAEQACRQARSLPIGLAGYAPVVATAPDAALLAKLQSSLLAGELELSFQPIVAVAGGEEAQFQVLLRMRDGDDVHSAGELVPMAENAGLMPDIDRWVLGQAIDLLRQRREDPRALRLFVSQSPRTMARDQHAAWLLEMLGTHAIQGPTLVIDLRLQDALVHSVALRQFCDQLMPAGVQFCLSQYAHGEEADALLPQLPLGYLRLSPRYSHAQSDTHLRDELRSVIDRAHRLGLQVIGQQVEDPQGAATLWMSGIDYIQGNLVQHAASDLDFDFQHSVL